MPIVYKCLLVPGFALLFMSALLFIFLHFYSMVFGILRAKPWFLFGEKTHYIGFFLNY